MKRIIKYYLNMIRTKILLLFFAVLAVLFVLLVVFNINREERLIKEIYAANEGLLLYHSGTIENKLKTAEIFFKEQKLDQSNYLAAENAESELDQYLAADSIKNTFEYAEYEIDFLTDLFLFVPERNSLIFYSLEDDEDRAEKIYGVISELQEKGMFDSSIWIPELIDDQHVIMYFQPIHNSYMGGVINADLLLAENNVRRTDTLEEIVLLDQELRPVSGGNVAENLTDFSIVEDTYCTIIDKKYMACLVDVRNEDFYILGLTDYDTISVKSNEDGIFLLIGAIIVILFAIGLFKLLWSHLVKPLSNIEAGMEKLREGDFKYQLEKEKGSEFSQITETFNSMSNNIENLKIAVYEEKLDKQKIELQFLQSQLNPHFLINCINNLRTLELMGDSKAIHMMLLALGDYLRGNMTMQKLIPLENEMKNVSAYVQLQQIRYKNRIKLNVEIYEELLSVMVPIHVVQTFVENSIKYCLSSENNVEISVNGDLDEIEENMLVLSISDDGKGFSEEILEMYNSGKTMKKEGRECIGIVNTATRLKLLLGENAKLECSNNRNGGAMVVIRIPILEEDYECIDA